MNKVSLKGNLGNNPELRYTSGGTAVCNFRLATNEYWKDKQSGEKRERTEWHRITVWGKQAENCAQFLIKGAKVLLDGRIRTREWNDKYNQHRFTTEIEAYSIEFLTRGKEQNEQQTAQSEREEDSQQSLLPEDVQAEANQIFHS